MSLQHQSGETALNLSNDLLREVEQFLFAEAELLDSWQIGEWFQLFTQDCRYWVPSNTDDQDPEAAVSLIYDDWSGLRDRMARLLSPLVFSQQPRARTRRLISNVRLGSVREDEVEASSNFLLYEVRLTHERVLAGRLEHVLQRQGTGWRIRKKKVALLSNDTAMIPISLLL